MSAVSQLDVGPDLTEREKFERLLGPHAPLPTNDYHRYTDTRVIHVCDVVFARIFPNVTEIVVRPICRPNFNNLEPITGVLKSAAVLEVLHLKIVLVPKVGLEFLWRNPLP